MKKILVVGSTVVDVIIQIERLPRTQEDIHVISQKMSLGGCAYNTFDIIRHFGVPCILFSPVGGGAYGDFVRARLSERGIHSPIPTPQSDNGCCYCFVEKNGERTFLSYHGAEYLFEKEWFGLLDPEELSCVYICGLEIEERTGKNIVAWLEEHPELEIYFAPGPRITRIDFALLKRLFALHPLIHLNENEVLAFHREIYSALTGAAANGLKSETFEATGSLESAAADTTGSPEYAVSAAADSLKSTAADAASTLESAAAALHALTQNTVIVTLGARGAYCHSSSFCGFVPGQAARQVDTIGAGDSHIGAVMACRALGKSEEWAIRTANLVAARVVETEGALLSDAAFAGLGLQL